MANGHQIEHVIRLAEEQVALRGFETGIDSNVIMLAGFGYLAHQINRKNGSMKKGLTLAGAVGLALGNGIMFGILQVLSKVN